MHLVEECNSSCEADASLGEPTCGNALERFCRTRLRRWCGYELMKISENTNLITHGLYRCTAGANATTDDIALMYRCTSGCISGASWAKCIEGFGEVAMRPWVGMLEKELPWTLGRQWAHLRDLLSIVLCTAMSMCFAIVVCKECVK